MDELRKLIKERPYLKGLTAEAVVQSYAKQHPGRTDEELIKLAIESIRSRRFDFVKL